MRICEPAKKNESESISNQRSLLREYVSGHAELVGSEILEFVTMAGVVRTSGVRAVKGAFGARSGAGR